MLTVQIIVMLFVGNLDKRGIGDVKTLTVEEYKALSEAIGQTVQSVIDRTFVMEKFNAP